MTKKDSNEGNNLDWFQSELPGFLKGGGKLRKIYMMYTESNGKIR